MENGIVCNNSFADSAENYSSSKYINYKTPFKNEKKMNLL